MHLVDKGKMVILKVVKSLGFHFSNKIGGKMIIYLV
jgi:hypothetical protein